MGKTACKRLKGQKQFRQRLMLAMLSSIPILVEDIRPDEASPGLRPHEVSLLRPVETISDDCSVEIYDTGTKLGYKPGVVMGGKHRVHDCGLSRSIGYFLEPFLVLSLFGKKSSPSGSKVGSAFLNPAHKRRVVLLLRARENRNTMPVC